MLSQDFYSQIRQLPIRERLALIDVIVQSIHDETSSITPPRSLATSLLGLAKTNDLPPTDAEVEKLLDERRAAKYL